MQDVEEQEPEERDILIEDIIAHEADIIEAIYQAFRKLKVTTADKQRRIVGMIADYHDLLTDSLKTPTLLDVETTVNIFRYHDYIRNFYIDLSTYISLLSLQEMYITGKTTTKKRTDVIKNKNIH